MDYKEQIAHLKKLTLAKDADFSAAVNYFLTISEDAPLMQHSAVLEKQHAFFKELLSPVAKHYGEKVVVEKLYLMDVNACDFVHGIAMLSNSLAIGLYFFDTLKTGMAFNGSPTKRNDFFRLTAFETEKSHQPSSGNTIIPSAVSKTYH